ncbi:MAG TPA: 3-deoxy-manno-octulosonate cytidylyltransferase [Gemmatimonadota bacterium]|nr:3-deoxy-manno-octulosonate cytidylyltransferase [Gemmatimonadota bacterium]
MILGAIPARWGATRFPGKALADVAGRPLIAWVVEAARGSRTLDAVVVVTDHAGIASAATAAGARAVVIAREAASGTDRIAHLLAEDERSSAAQVVVNVQGDEPLLEPDAIDAAVRALRDDPGADVSTLARRLRSGERADDPNLVKVAVTDAGRALYFSRSPVPHGAAPTVHVGLYAYRRAAFDRFAAAAPTRLERTERLEQLRALEIGLSISVVPYDSRSIGVDSPGDVARVEAELSGALGR